MLAPESQQKLVSIVIPAYNAQDFIDASLLSIETQSYQTLEIIVVDDGSTDGTRAIVREHANRDARVFLVEQPNLYAGVARNNGLAHAKGDYVLFLDADDLFSPVMVECLVRRAEETEADVTICRSCGVDRATGHECALGASLKDRDFSEVRSGHDLRDEMFWFCGGWAWDKLYRTDFVKKEGLSFQSTRTSNDACFVFTSLMVASRIAFVEEVLVRHLVNNAQSLEGSRDRSYGNALDAVNAISHEIRARGLVEDFGRSFDNWCVTFLLWNFSTLSHEVKPQFMQRVLQEVVPLLPAHPEDGYFRHGLECSIAKLWTENDRVSLTCSATESEQRSYQLFCDLENARREAKEAAQRADELSTKLDAVYSSRAYRVGRALMKVPHEIKVRVSR